MGGIAGLPAQPQVGKRPHVHTLLRGALRPPCPELAQASEASRKVPGWSPEFPEQWSALSEAPLYSIFGLRAPFAGTGEWLRIRIFTRKFIFTEPVLTNSETFQMGSELGYNQLRICF